MNQLEEQASARLEEARLRDYSDRDLYRFKLWDGTYIIRAWDLDDALEKLLGAQEVPWRDKDNYRFSQLVLEIQLRDEAADG